VRGSHEKQRPGISKILEYEGIPWEAETRNLQDPGMWGDPMRSRDPESPRFWKLQVFYKK
jgi:hypothetical protein